MISMIGTWILLFAGGSEEIPFTHESFDGFKIDAKLALPEGVAEEEVARVVILLGGSGPYDMDLNLTAIAKGGVKILWLKDVSDALAKGGFAVVRYHKRAYYTSLLGHKLQREKRTPTPEEEAPFREFIKNPLKYFVEDCKSFAEAARKRFPKAKIYLLGASEGTHVALWAAHELGWISGVALVGFYALSLDVLMFEQTVVREFQYFADVDQDRDDTLTKEELKKGKETGQALLWKFAEFDLDGDGRIAADEFRGRCLEGLSAILETMKVYREQEAKYPSMISVLKEASVPILFFQGAWDNQTPAYNTFCIESLAKKWKKDGFAFHYFPKLGHCLDPRDSYMDKAYRPIDAEALKKVVAEMDKSFR